MRYHAFTVVIEKPCCLLLLAISHNYTQIHGQRLYIYMVYSYHRIDWQPRQGTLSALKPIQIQDIKHNSSMPHMNFGQAGFRRKMLWSTTGLTFLMSCWIMAFAFHSIEQQYLWSVHRYYRDHLPTPSALSVSIVVVKQVGIELLYIFKLLIAH